MIHKYTTLLLYVLFRVEKIGSMYLCQLPAITADETRNGLFLLRDGVANVTGIRGHEHNQKRATAKSGQRRCKSPSCIVARLFGVVA